MSIIVLEIRGEKWSSGGMATHVISPQDIRMFLMDTPEANTLIQGVKWTDEDIDRAAEFVVDAYNSIPPPIDYVASPEDFPRRYLLLIGVAGHLLRGSAVSEANNELTYSAGGVQVADRGGAGKYTELGNNFWREFLEMSRQIKITNNANSFFGSVSSEFQRGRRY